jgi:hypothetical protein
MLISTALLLDSNIRNSVCTPAKLPCRRVEVGYEIIRKGFNVSSIEKKMYIHHGGGYSLPALHPSPRLEI